MYDIFIINQEWVYKVRFLYSNKTSTDDQKLYAVFNYTLLFDNSYYKAYFTADNNLISNPDLMKGIIIKNNQILKCK